jgi:hypothetical protein
MATALNMIENSLRNIGALAIDETLSAAEAQDSLNVLNNMISTWNIENLMVYSVNEEVFPVVANQPSYTMGIGGNFNTTRPVAIEDAYMRDAAGNDFKIGIVNHYAYSMIITKNTTSALPSVLYDNEDFPLKTLKFWPIASDASYSFVLWTLKAITSFPILTTVVSLPPGYQSAIEYNLSIWLSPRYGVSVSSDLRELAVTTKAQIKKKNYEVKALSFDSNLTKEAKGFNYLTGI